MSEGEKVAAAASLLLLLLFPMISSRMAVAVFDVLSDRYSLRELVLHSSASSSRGSLKMEGRARRWISPCEEVVESPVVVVAPKFPKLRCALVGVDGLEAAEDAADVTLKVPKSTGWNNVILVAVPLLP